MSQIVTLRNLSNEEKVFVRNCVDVIHRIVRLYGFDDCHEGSNYKVKGTYSHWIYCCSMVPDHPMKFVKYKIAAYYSTLKGQVIPDSIWNKPNSEGHTMDNSGVLMGGRVMKYLNLLGRVNKHSFESFVTSILYSKKGMPRPNIKLLKEAELATFNKLTKAPIEPIAKFLYSWGEENDRKISSFINKDVIINAITDVVEEVFTKPYTDDDRQKMFFPSTSANYNNTRTRGGVIGQLFAEHKDLLSDLHTSDDLIQLGMNKIIDKDGDIDELSNMPCIDMSKLNEQFSILYKRICDKALMEEIPNAVPLGLPEALKVRTITKGPGLLYTALKPLQMFLIKHLSGHPAFTLTGKTVDDLTLQDMIGAKLKADESFMSVDYSDATNQIESWATNAAMEAISDRIGLTVEEEMMSLCSLTGHKMILKDSKGHILKSADQLNGQLMGGILSFIILCVINAAVLKLTKEITDDRKYTLRDTHVAINGDDGVLKTTLAGMRNWESIGSFVGLSPSVGKVYFSREFLNINSTTYNYYPQGWLSYTFTRSNGDKYHRTSHFEHVKYVNMGLMLSMKRSGNGLSSIDEDARGTSFGGRVTDLISSAPEFLQERVLGQFLHMNKSKIIVDLPYFIPENMGGLGLPSVGKYTSSDRDLRYARMIHQHPDVFKMPNRPLNAMWKTWEYATKRFPMKNLYLNTDDLIESSNSSLSLTDIRGKACIEAIFRISDINVLLQETASDTSILHFQRNCQKVWKKARLSEIPVPEPYVQGKFPIIYDNNNRKLFLDTTKHIETLQTNTIFLNIVPLA